MFRIGAIWMTAGLAFRRVSSMDWCINWEMEIEVDLRGIRFK
jgi:hypothetical protein